MLQVRVRWTDTNINFGKLALWRYLSLIQLDNQRQHSTLYIIYWWRLLHNPSRFPYAIAVSFGSAIAIVSHSSFGLPISRARVLILKHSLDRRIVVLLDFWFSCAHTAWDTLRQMLLETVDGRRSTADCRLHTVVIVFCAGVAVAVAVDWHCIEKCYVEFLCILHRPCGDEGRLLSSTKQKRSKLVARAFVQNFVHVLSVERERGGG